MVEFDDVLAMDARDDWDSYDTTGRAPAEESHLAAAVTARLHSALVVVRGELPHEVVEAFADLTADQSDPGAGTDRSDGLGGDASARELSDDGAGRIGHEPGFGDGDGVVLVEVHVDPAAEEHADELVRRTTAAVVERLRELDRENVHIDAAAVVRGGDPRRGVLVLHPDPVVRHHLVDELVSRGAGFAAADDTIVVPGTRTVFGSAFPLQRSDGPAAPSATGEIARHAAVETVILVDTGEGPAETVDLAAAEGIAAWLENSPDLVARYGPGVLDAIVTATARSGFRQVRADSIDSYVEAIIDGGSALGTAADQQEQPTVLLHRFDRAIAGEGHSAVGGPLRSLRVARIGDSGVLVDGASGVVTELEASEIDAIEAAATSAPVRGRAAAVATTDDRLQRIRSLGVDLSVISGRPSTAEAHALPNSARSTSSASRTSRADNAAALSVLADVLGYADGADIRPIVFGSVVTAFDTTAPASAVDIDRIDVLLHKNELEHIVELLVAAGYSVTGGSPDDEHADEPVSVVMRSPVGDGAPDPHLVVTVGLHAMLSVGHFSELVDHDEVRRRATPVLIGGRWCDALHPTDRFVLTCTRFEQRGPDQRLARDVVLNAPRLEPVMAAALEASDRWGTTRDVLAAVRGVDAALPGLSPWLVERATRYESDRRSKRSRNRRR